MRTSKAAGADLVEIRVDLLAEDERNNWKTILDQKLLPVIVTNRASWEGGSAPDDEFARFAILSSAILAGADYVDIEFAAFDEFKRYIASQNSSVISRIILSHHNFERALTLEEIRTIYEKMVGKGADICKIAMATTSARDNAVIFQALREASRRPLVLIAMGELGQCSRILAPKFSSFLTFSCVGHGRESAPGQVSTEALINLYRFRSLSPSTRVFGVIGDPVLHSMSPALHNASFGNAGIDAVYVPLRVNDDVPAFIRSMILFGFDGFSVTIPGKVAALKAMDEVDNVTAKIGAMNTVVTLSDGRLRGYNTDWIAAISAIEDALTDNNQSFHGARVLCLGAGGAARGLVFGAVARGASHVVVANRTLSKAQELANDVGSCASAVSYDALLRADAGQTASDRNQMDTQSRDADSSAEDRMLSFDVVMNTTSIGMHPRTEETPLSSEALRRMGRPLVFDAVYNPLQTKLLLEAEELGCICVSGLEMFVRQAAEQFKLWFPKLEPNVSLMRSVVTERLANK